MAVKYSKQRDFGVLNRKSRKIDNQMWTKRRHFLAKSNAKKLAKEYRKKGYKARVISQGGIMNRKGRNVYIVYTHTK
jgi:hypothetical protein